MKPCFAFTKKGETPTLAIFDEIGFWGVQAKDFRETLAAVQGEELNVEINSPGGDAFAGLAIYNMLKSSGKKVNMKVMGVAASAASMILMAGTSIAMPKNTFIMVHNPMTIVMGNSSEMREAADYLDKVGTGFRMAYADKTGMKDEELDAMLSKDTWLSAEEALEKGFITEVIDEIKVSALASTEQLPARIAAIFKTEAPTPVAEQIKVYASAEKLEAYAPHLALACTSMDAAKARVSQIREITSLCALAKADAAPFVNGNKSPDETRDSLLTAMATAEPITNSTRPTPTESAKSGGVSTQSIWASHNRKKD